VENIGVKSEKGFRKNRYHFLAAVAKYEETGSSPFLPGDCKEQI